MSLAPGTRLGPYEVTTPIGAGGMGEVHRARDTRLDRTVAIKTLPPALASDPEFRARFEREARAISQLQHPNICTLYDVGRHDETDYLVLEYLEGETLAARLDRRALDHDVALTLAVQIAGALDAAHRKGIVHRDLKPGNVMLVRGPSASAPPVVKLLDFGLAKPVAATVDAASATSAPTQTTPLTARGTVLGTIQYMAPEQLEGREADARSDIWAFGCLLYEMLSGRRAFEGASPASLISAILRDQPEPVTTVAPVVPPALDHVVSTCLAKDPDDRWQSAGDLARELRWIRDASPAPVIATGALERRSRGSLVLVGAGVMALAVLAIGFLARRPAPDPGPVLRAELAVAVDSATDDSAVAISADGGLLAYVTPDARAVMLRDLRNGQVRTLAEGQEYSEPFFSPDGLQVGFVGGRSGIGRAALWGSLQRVAVGGGAPVTIVDGLTGLKGASWGDDGWVYYSPAPAAGLWRVRAEGGASEQLTTPDVANGEKTHRRPFVLPGSRAVLFVTGTSRITSFDDATIEVLSLADHSRHRLIDGGTAPRYIPALRSLAYSHAGTLIGVPFDADRLALDGPPVTLANGIADEPANGLARYTLSSEGTFVWAPGAGRSPQAAVVMVDRDGRATKIADAPDSLRGRLSPDGTRVALEPDGATQQLVTVDLIRNSAERLTYEWDNARPVWTPDSPHLLFQSNAGGGRRNIYMRAGDSTGTAERVTESALDQTPNDVWGHTLVYEQYAPATRTDLWTLSLDERVPRVLRQTPFDELLARISPDGRWIAYQSDQSGSWEVYVQAFPSPAQQWPVSTGGGTQPLWLPGTRGLAYLKGLDVMEAAVTASPTFTAGRPAKRFSLEPGDRLIDVTRDGRYVVLRGGVRPFTTSLGIIVNWFEAIRH
jgi:serine/threonine-protein kinase